MMTLAASWYGILFVVVVIVIRIIVAIAHTAEKSRRSQSGGQVPAPPGRNPNQPTDRVSPTGFSGGPVTTRTSIDELAARRQAQIEQLRQRREIRKAGPSVQAAPVRPDQVQRMPGVPIPQAGSLSDLQAQRVREAREKQRTGEAKAAQQRAGNERFAAAEKARKGVQQQKVRTQVAADAAQVTHTEQVAAAKVVSQRAAAAPSQFMPSIRDQLQQKYSLRQILVLKEILDPPVSLRSGEN